MRGESETKDLLKALAQEREVTGRIRRVSLTVVASLFIVLGLIEPFAFGSIYLIGGACLCLVGAVLLAVALGYSASVFLATWTFGNNVQDQGQTRPTVGQVITILFLCSAGALPIAAFALQDAVDAWFWTSFAVLTWNNVSCACLGYGSAFWTRLRPRPRPPVPATED